MQTKEHSEKFISLQQCITWVISIATIVGGACWYAACSSYSNRIVYLETENKGLRELEKNNLPEILNKISKASSVLDDNVSKLLFNEEIKNNYSILLNNFETIKEKNISLENYIANLTNVNNNLKNEISSLKPDTVSFSMDNNSTKYFFGGQIIFSTHNLRIGSSKVKCNEEYATLSPGESIVVKLEDSECRIVLRNAQYYSTHYFDMFCTYKSKYLRVQD